MSIATVALAVTGLGACGGGSGADEGVEALQRWVQGWRNNVRGTPSAPPTVRIKPPPTVDLPATATQLGSQVDQSAALVTRETGAEVKGTFCTWFGFYVSTGETVPTADQLGVLLLRRITGRVITAPPPLRLRSAVEGFVSAVERAQTEDEAVRNAAIAAACAV